MVVYICYIYFSQCRMSNLRNAYAIYRYHFNPMSHITKAHVALSNLRNAHVALSFAPPPPPHHHLRFGGKKSYWPGCIRSPRERLFMNLHKKLLRDH